MVGAGIARRVMRIFRFISLIAVIVLVIGGSLTALARAVSSERVYAVDSLLAAAAHSPPTWMGRTILVRGAIVGTGFFMACPIAMSVAHCHQTVMLYLTSSDSQHSKTPYTVVGGPPIPAMTNFPSSPSGGELRIRVPSNEVAPQSERPLPAFLYSLPFFGSILTRLFPPSNTITVRVRLKRAYFCATQANVECADSVLLTR